MLRSYRGQVCPVSRSPDLVIAEAEIQCCEYTRSEVCPVSSIQVSRCQAPTQVAPEGGSKSLR
jgi:hypothetical protein